MIQSKLRWYHGLLAIALFGAVMALEYFGLLGKHVYATVIGEGLIALVAIGVVLIARENLSAVFTFKKVRWVQIAGLYLMWRGVLSAEMVLSEVLMHFFPRLMRETSGIEEWMHRVPFALAFFVTAVIPAVCEEMLFRGTLLHSMKDLKKPWLIIILNGLIFGIAHLSSIIGWTTSESTCEGGQAIADGLNLHDVDNVIMNQCHFLACCPCSDNLIVRRILGKCSGGGTLADADLHRAQSLYAPAGQRAASAGTEGDSEEGLAVSYRSSRFFDLCAGTSAVCDRL